MESRYEMFTVLINRISRNIRKIKNQEMAEYNLRSVHVSCLYHLYMSDGLTATELCERCEEDKATISRGLDHLETNGFIICNTNNAKRYKSPLFLTEKGKEAGKKIADKIAEVLESVGGMTEKERVVFYRNLTLISDSLEAVSNKSKK